MQPKDTSSSTKPARLTGEISNSIVLLLSNIVHIGPKNRQIPHYSRVFGVVFSLNTNANKVIWKFNKLAIHRWWPKCCNFLRRCSMTNTKLHMPLNSNLPSSWLFESVAKIPIIKRSQSFQEQRVSLLDALVLMESTLLISSVLSCCRN
jgi:hypothetical protein